MRVKSLAQFTSKERQIVLKLHARLKEIERFLVKEENRIKKSLEPRLKKDLSEYEIEVLVTYWLKKSDPAYNAANNQTVAEYWDFLEQNSLHNRSDTVFDWDKISNWKEVFPKVKMCWLFFDLINHHGIKWSDLLRIGKIWVGIVPKLQIYHPYKKWNEDKA